MFDVYIDIVPTPTILNSLGLQKGGPVQAFFTNSVLRHMAKYMPGGNRGHLVRQTIIGSSKDELITNSPAARYLYHGKLMVDPKTGKGAFFSPAFGFWSRPGVKKVLTNKDLNFKGAPLQGSFWAERMWIAEGDQITLETERFVERGGL